MDGCDAAAACPKRDGIWPRTATLNADGVVVSSGGKPAPNISFSISRGLKRLKAGAAECLAIHWDKLIRSRCTL